VPYANKCNYIISKIYVLKYHPCRKHCQRKYVILNVKVHFSNGILESDIVEWSAEAWFELRVKTAYSELK
jgi:hypothetical protein